MAIDFPNSPTDGELFTAGSTKWIYNAAAGKWNIAAPETPSTTAFAPIGTVINYMGSSPPNGWILCNGASLSRSTYANLFAVLGTTFGQGSNPGSTFAIPNFIGTTGIYLIRATDEAVALSAASNLLAMPVGTMSLFAMTTVPGGWVRCDGQALSRTSYADLFSAISTTYGTGDGSTTFNVPNIPGSGTGSPLYYIKAILSGDAQPATVAHASSHIRTGTDIIDGDRLQVDFVPSFYTRNSSQAEAGASTDLTAHLKGIDTKVSSHVICTSSTRPGSPYDGQIIYETDTKRELIYNGSAWVIRANYALTYTPTFWVRRSSTTTTVATIVFDSVYENVGSHYSTTTGLFTAPVDGVYQFHAQGISNTTGGWGFIFNGSLVSGPTPYQTYTNWTNLAASVTKYMTANQTMGVYLRSGNFYGDSGWFHNAFSGSLVSYR